MFVRTALLLALTLAGTATAKEIRLKNPGFEEPATVHDPVGGWRASQHSGEDSYEFTTVGDVFFKGKRSFRLTRIKDQVFGSLDQAVPAAPLAGHKIEFRFQLRAEDVGPQGFHAFINFTANTGDLLQQIRGEDVTGTVDKWKTFTVTTTVPHDVQNVILGLTLLDAGTVWVDEVSLRTLDDVKPTKAPKTPKNKGIFIP